MVGDGYLTKLGRDSQNEISIALCFYFKKRLSKTEPEDFAGRLGAAVAMTIVGEPAQESQHQVFREENSARIDAEARTLASDKRIGEILSGAAYNIGYGRYVDKGGGRLFNAYLSYMRLEGRALSRSDNERMLSYRLSLTKRDPAILRPVEALKRLDLWISRNSPNELEYYKAVHLFALENKVIE